MERDEGFLKPKTLLVYLSSETCSIDHKFILSHQQEELRMGHKEYSNQKEKCAFYILFHNYNVMIEEQLWDEWNEGPEHLVQFSACDKHSHVYNKHYYPCHTT